jgi:hypothetical protein
MNPAIISKGTRPAIMIITKHPAPVTALPIFRCRPLLVSGIPIDRESLDFAAEMPTARFHENPPLFIL